MIASVSVQAPGKVMLSGEYAVLDGAPATVMAVDRHAIALASVEPLTDEDGWETPELVAALGVALSEGYVRQGIHVRVRPGTLFDGARKLGLGSSAAMCVAGLGAAMRLCREDIDHSRAKLAEMALAGHRRAQGGGSGVDVYASAYGGVFGTVIEGGVARGFEPLAWPKGARWRVLWTGEPVSTKGFVAQVRALAERSEREYRALIDRVRAASEAFQSAMRAGDAGALVRATDEHGMAMDALGQGAGVAIVTEPMRALFERGRALGCAMKPSGAGGGDIVLAVSERDDALAALDGYAREQGMVPLNLCVDERGVSDC
jgi:phosphomevalonate kinase